jgi:hypothetical protein
VPNPAQPFASAYWLNAALMASGRQGLCAIADTPRLEHIIERQLVGDTLGADPERTARQDVDLALPESSRTAAVVDPRGVRLVGKNGPRAVPAAMLELRKGKDIGDALPNGSMASWNSTDLPHPGFEICERGWWGRLRSGSRQGARSGKNHQPAHGKPI